MHDDGVCLSSGVNRQRRYVSVPAQLEGRGCQLGIKILKIKVVWLGGNIVCARSEYSGSE